MDITGETFADRFAINLLGKGGTSMKNNNEVKIFQAALYLRLSTERVNETLGQSDSIVNQEALLRSYVDSHPEIHIYKVYKDDGWSGVNFDRPAFQRMMQDVYDGKLNCIIVKDLSRLGRNHTETGRYISRVFPAFEVRFIAVNDNIDSLNSNEDMDNIIVPFKDLLNDSYSRDISIKLRSAFDTKRKQGEHVGGFVPFGYRKDPDDKKKIIVDQDAAIIVRQIFKWTIEGKGSTPICRKLNEMKIPCPSEYRQLKAQGKLLIATRPGWNTAAIHRILRNEIYIGVLEQGKFTTPNYKVRKKIKRPDSEVYRFEHAFEPIIPEEQFRLVQNLLMRDTRTPDGEEYINPLGGFIYCGHCGGSMIRYTARAKDNDYLYYVCSRNKSDKNVCGRHGIRIDRVNELVLAAMNLQLELLFDVDDYLKEKELMPYYDETVETYQLQIANVIGRKNRDLQRIEECRHDYDDGILTESEYDALVKGYRKAVRDADKSVARLEAEKADFIERKRIDLEWIKEYRDNGRIEKLTRKVVVAMIDKVLVYSKDHIKIVFRFEDEIRKIYEQMNLEHDADRLS